MLINTQDRDTNRKDFLQERYVMPFTTWVHGSLLP